MTILDENILPFGDSESLPADIEAPANPIPFTLVNSKPLDSTPFVAPYVPLAHHIIAPAIDMAQLTPKDILADMGCGDGRILGKALSSTSIQKCLGVELDPYLGAHIQKTYPGEIASSRFVFLQQDMFQVDLNQHGVTVMILYLLPGGLEKLKPMLEAWFHVPGNIKKRIVTVTYSIPGWNAIHGKQIPPLEGQCVSHWIFYYDETSIV